MKFSIIIPVYNVEEYVEECIESIICQTFQDYEVILVNDGSTDSSGLICNRYAEQYTGFTVFHQKNQGISATRNIGVAAAKGDYLFFVDSDDKLADEHVLEWIAKRLSGCDVCVFGWQAMRADGELLHKNLLPGIQKEYPTGEAYLQDALRIQEIYPWYVWRYVFRREFWLTHGFAFRAGFAYEDVELLYRVFLKAKRVCTEAEQIGYLYRTERSGSIVTEMKETTYVQWMKVVEECITRVQEDDSVSPQLKKQLCNNFSCMYYSAVASLVRLQTKEERKRVIQLLKAKQYLCKYTSSRRKRIIFWFLKIFGISGASQIFAIRWKWKMKKLRESV